MFENAVACSDEEPLWRVERSPNRSITSKMVTKMERTIKKIHTHVWSKLLVRTITRGRDRERHTWCLIIRYRIRQNLCKIKKHATPFIQYLNPRFDFKVLSHCDVQRVQGGFAFPEEIRHIEDIGRCKRTSALPVYQTYGRRKQKPT